MKRLLYVMLMLGLSISVQAATYTWNGGGGNANLALSSNWADANVPVDGVSGAFVFDADNLEDPFNTNVQWNVDNITITNLLLNGNGTYLGFSATGAGEAALAGPVAVQVGTHSFAPGIVLSNNVTVDVQSGGVLTKESLGISGAFGIVKTGAGTLALETENTFSGGLTVNGGTLSFSENDNRLGVAGIGISLDGGTLSQTGVSDISSGRTYTIGAGGGELSVAGGRWANSGTVAGSFVGTGDVTKTGAGTLYINKPDNRTAGNLIIEEGTYEISFANRLRGDSSVTIMDGARLLGSYSSANIQNATTRSLILDGDATVAISGTASYDFGDVSGTGLLRVDNTSTGQLILSGNNSYSGGTLVQAGALVGNVDGALGTGNVTVTDGVLILTNGVLDDYIDDAAALVLDADSALSLDFPGTDTVGGISLDGGATTLLGGTYTAAQLSELGSGTYSGTGSLQVGAPAVEVFSQNAVGLLTSDAVWDPVAPGVSNVAVWAIAGNTSRKNALGGDASWLGIRVDAAVTRDIIIEASGSETLTLGSWGIDMSVVPNDATRNLFDINTGVALGAIQVWNVAETATGPSVDPRILTVNGSISGGAGNTLVKAGSGALVINSENNTFEGGVVILGGTLTANVDGALGVGDVTVTDGELILSGGVSDDYIDDAAALVLGTNAVLNLDFSGTDTVGGISLDGGATTLLVGTYTAAQLSALGDGTYSGSGSLQVASDVIEIGTVDYQFLPGGSNLSLSWTAESGASYAVQTNGNLVSGEWADYQTGITGSGGVSVTNDLIGPVGFFRIIVE